MSVKIEHGAVVVEGKAITSVEIIEEPDPTSETLLSVTIDVVLKTPSVDEFVANDDISYILTTTHGIEMEISLVSYKQTSKDTWQFEFGNYVKKLEKYDFHGDIYSEKNAYDLISEIMGAAGITTFSCDAEILSETMTVSGHIPYTTCKEALRQVLFTIGAMASSDKGVPYFSLMTHQKNVPKGRALNDAKVETEEGSRYDTIELTTHSYTKNDDTISNLYSQSGSPTKDEPMTFYAVFDEPHHNFNLLEFTTVGYSVSFKLIEESANHYWGEWYVTGIGGDVPASTVRLEGDGYNHTTAKQSKQIGGTGQGSKLSVEDVTLITSSNADEVIDRLAAYYTVNTNAVVKVVVGKHVSDDGVVTYDEDIRCGDVVTVPTSYQGTYTGRVIKEQYNLNGNIIIKEITLK